MLLIIHNLLNILQSSLVYKFPIIAPQHIYSINFDLPYTSEINADKGLLYNEKFHSVCTNSSSPLPDMNTVTSDVELL